MSIPKKKPTDKDPGYPPYPSSEDIYNRNKEADDVDPEKPTEEKPQGNPVENNRGMVEDPLDADTDNAEQRVGIDPEDSDRPHQEPEKADAEALDEEDRMGGDLDVPGAELDDADEDIGEEDEQNNYYSLGGDKDPEDNRDYTS